MHSLFLIQVDSTRPAGIARGVKDALRYVGHPDEQIIPATADICTRAIAGELPIQLHEGDDEALAREAATVLEEQSHGAAIGAVDLPEDQLRDLATTAARANAEPDAADDAFVQHLDPEEGVTRDAALTALALLASNNGNVPTTFNLARILARTTGDSDLYVEVCQIICTTFDIRVQ